MLKNEIKDILMYYFDNDEDCKTAAEQICDKIEDEMMRAFKTVLNVQIHGIPQ